jgi:arylsulfatase A-like enzyme
VIFKYYKKTQLFLFFFFIILVGTQVAQQKKNILFIAVDDLKPNLGCYGDKFAISPNIDKLADEGIIFTNNQCQQAVCGPSRASLLTGYRPDRTKVWDLKTLIRDKNPDIITLPQYFMQNGYQTTGTGKIFDPRSVDKKLDEPSWSIPFSNVHGNRWMVSSEKVSTESSEIAEEEYTDGKIAAKGLELLENLASGSAPFFLAVGFKKPHLPFVAPQKYWDLYDRDSVKIAPFQEHAANSPSYVYNNGGELRNNYVDIPKSGDISIEKQKELIHGYYACVSFIDAQIGKLLDKVDSLGIKDNTIIVLWGDHGWHLGDHAQWTKHTNFEQATRSPLIFSVPSISGGKKNSSPTEFVDIFPTLCELTGVSIPSDRAGTSLVPLINDPTAKVKDYAVSQYKKAGYEGYTIRTERYRYTEWIDLEYREGTKPYDANIVYDRELYDYKNDPLETVSLINNPNYQNVLDSLKSFLSEFLIHQFDDPTSVQDKREQKKVPQEYGISNYPNPFNPTTTIEYSIPVGAPDELPLQQRVLLKVYNVLGKEVATLVNKKQLAGTYRVLFDGSNLTSGVYLYRFQAGKFSEFKKIILLR